MSNRDYLLLIYTCMCIILFLMMIILSFQRHQIRMLSAGLGMAWNRYGLSCIMYCKCSLEKHNAFIHSNYSSAVLFIGYRNGFGEFNIKKSRITILDLKLVCRRKSYNWFGRGGGGYFELHSFFVKIFFVLLFMGLSFDF